MPKSFSRSMFANDADLYKAKAEYFESLHNELIMAVARKWKGETRHETALKYIKQAEESNIVATEPQQQAHRRGRE